MCSYHHNEPITYTSLSQVHEKILLARLHGHTTPQNCSSYVSGSSICKAQGGDFASCLWHEFLFSHFVPALLTINLFDHYAAENFCFLGGAGSR